MRTPSETNSAHDGTQKLYYFDNGYGASVVCHQYSYGGSKGLWELAVLSKTDDGYQIDYSTEITNDVEGNLTVKDVESLLDRIAVLPTKG